MSNARLPTEELLVWDSSALLHAGRCDRLDVLLADACDPGGETRHITTATVQEELAAHGVSLPPAVSVVHVDALAELWALVAWMQRLSSGRHDRGEATVCAWAQVHGATAVLDDGDARRIAKGQDLPLHGSAWLLARRAAASGQWGSASRLADLLLADGARYPFPPGGLRAWAEKAGLT